MELAASARVHEELSDLVAAMMGAACGSAPPRSHLSLFALGGTDQQAAELARADAE